MIIIIASIIISRANEASELATVNLSHIDQIRYDWSEIPFTSLDVRSAAEGCRSDEFYVWFKDFGGTEMGCYTDVYSPWGEVLETVAENEY